MTSAPPPRRPSAAPWVVLSVVGALMLLAALVPLAGGGFLLWANGTQPDAGGFFTSRSHRFETAAYAITSERVELRTSLRNTGRDVGMSDLATVLLDVRGTGAAPVFVGIARRADVDRYLAGVASAEVADLRLSPFAVTYRYRDGDAPATPPGAQSFWVASAQGRGDQRVVWEAEPGDWSVVVMNADGRPGVSVDARVGVRTPWVFRAGVGLTVAGLIGVGLGALLLVLGIRGLGSGEPAPVGGPDDGLARAVTVEGRLDERLSRGLWLVKWVLLIPHLIVLAALWMAFAVVTVIAFFSILITERYPRALFDFNLGVLRWTWRVGYYGYSALGTDQYPPFSLGPEPDYPATLAIAYPEHLSRGLVLVKWWLLAIPHYLVLAFIAGGSVGAGSDPWRFGVPAGGLLGILVLIAGVALLVTGRYPRDLHALVMGLNRWVLRVTAYVALMRDDYPPFRLDQGGAEPGGEPGPPAPRPPESSGADAEAVPSAPAEAPAPAPAAPGAALV